MGFLQVLQKFENKIINEACKEDIQPENMLTKAYIANAFLEFVKNLGIEEDDTYYLRWYEEEHNKNSELQRTDFIYHTVLGIQDKMDISEEYLRLYDSLSEYQSVLRQKKSQFEKELRTLAKDKKNKRDKIIFYKNEIENRLNESECFNKKYLIERAWGNCTIPYYMRWFKSDFSMDIYSAQNVDVDRRRIIFWGDLSFREAEKMIALKKENASEYSDAFENMIYSLDIVGRVKKIVENNFYINDRLPIISAAITLFMEKQYIAFVYLTTPQIEGLFRVLQQSIRGDRSCTSGMQELIEKINKNEDFMEFTYFAYDFPEWRNKIAHGEMIKVDRELACEIMMDLYWILSNIDSEEQDYKKWMSFLDDFCSKQDLKMMAESLGNYFDSMESEKYLNLLKRYFQGEFDSILEWYGFAEQEHKFIETIRSERLYLLIWNDDPLELETSEKMEMVDGTIKEINVKKFNDNSLKYYRLLSLLNEYNYVPLEWYKKYLDFIGQLEAVKENIWRKIGINPNKIEVEEEDYHEKIQECDRADHAPAGGSFDGCDWRPGL